jgi:uncharacterized membrane protein
MTRRATAVSALARRLRPERGAVLLLASLITVTCLAATAFAVDLGRGVAAKRDLQSDADLAAIDAVRALGNKEGQGGLTRQALAEQLAEESLERNGFDIDTEGNSATVVLGVIDPDTRVFTATDPSVASAVKVTLNTPIEWAFQPGGRTFTASGVGRAGIGNNVCRGVCDDDDPETHTDALAGIALGSFLARVDTSGGLLKSIFGEQLNGNVTLVGYTGIAAGSLTLGELRTALNVGTVDALLTTQVTARNFLLAMVTVLQNRGDATSIQAATDLNNLALATDPSLNITLGDAITLADGGEGAATIAEISALHLAQMVAQLANGQNAIDIALTTQNMGGGLTPLLNLLGNNTLRLKVIEPLQIAFGPPGKDAAGQWHTRVETAQIRAQIHLRPLGLLDLPLYLEGASAQAALASVTCRSPLDASTVAVETATQTLKAYLGEVANINAAGPVTVNATTLLNVNVILTNVTVRGQGNVTVASGASPAGGLEFNGPFNWENTQTVSSTTVDPNDGTPRLGSLLQAPATQITTTPINVGWLITNVVNLVTPVLNVVDTNLLDPLLSALGVSLGGGDVTVFAIDCAAPSLGG